MKLTLCQWCLEDIPPAELGMEDPPFHRKCLVRAICGSAAHQLGECLCYGGNREDPPGMTKRQAAELAWETWVLLGAVSLRRF